MPKAFENPAFMLSTEARPLRILAEYLEPRARLEQHRVRRCITFWGSARLRPATPAVDDGRDYYAMARELGQRLARWSLEQFELGQRFHILTGGGPGIMEAAHAGAASVNRMLNVGLNIALPREQHANPYIPPSQIFEFHYFFTRKFWFLNLSRALVIFPGGFGTLDELFELLTLIQTGKADPRPIVLFGQRYWGKLIRFEHLLECGMIDAADLDLIIQVDTVDAAFDELTTALEAG